MVPTAERGETTLLRALVRERRLTVEASLDLLRARAERMREDRFSLSDRQFRRWMAGQVASAEGGRPANVRVVEEEFGRPITELLAPPPSGVAAGAPAGAPTLRPQLGTTEFIEWVVAHSGLGYELAYNLVADAARQLASRGAMASRRRHGDRDRLAEALGTYYGHPSGLWEGRVGSAPVALSVLAPVAWRGLSITLGGGAERCRLVERGRGPHPFLNDRQARRALDRLALAEATGTVLVNNPVYRLVGIDIGSGFIDARFGCSEFATYALTADLLEAELRDLVSSGVRDLRGAPTPHRDAWLPTLEAALDYGERDCVGGVVCLVAIADLGCHHLLVQERSATVLNVTGTLAVIPKAFHQPTVDPFDEAALSTTLERELEEELLGREDLELLAYGSGRRASPLHPGRSSLPMQWLHDHPDAWRMECTAFGINLVTGNFEVACLVVVEDPAWWHTYGHLLVANWEAMRLHLYSSMDDDGLVELVRDPRWNNEALFALVEGLRRLGELGHIHVPVTADGGS